MENHSYDNYFGMLGRGDGFTCSTARPTGRHEPRRHRQASSARSTCHRRASSRRRPARTGTPATPPCERRRATTASSRRQRPGGHGLLDGRRPALLLRAGQDVPAVRPLVRSCLGQTYPNRRFLHRRAPPTGIVSTTHRGAHRTRPRRTARSSTSSTRTASRGRNYYTDLPAGRDVSNRPRVPPTTSVADRRSSSPTPRPARCPPFRFVDPTSTTQSEENPQDIRSRRAVRLAGRQRGHARARPGTRPCSSGPTTSTAATTTTCRRRPRCAPDNVPPGIHARRDLPGGYDRYGFRVPAVIVSPYARKNYVSHVVHDHTSVLRLIETKWNLRALTYRDAQRRQPARLRSTCTAARRSCTRRRPSAPHVSTCTPGEVGGPIPPPSAIVHRNS